MLMREIFGQKRKKIMKEAKILVNMTIILRYIKITGKKSVRIVIMPTVRDHLKRQGKNHPMEGKI